MDAECLLQLLPKSCAARQKAALPSLAPTPPHPPHPPPPLLPPPPVVRLEQLDLGALLLRRLAHKHSSASAGSLAAAKAGGAAASAAASALHSVRSSFRGGVLPGRSSTLAASDLGSFMLGGQASVGALSHMSTSSTFGPGSSIGGSSRGSVSHQAAANAAAALTPRAVLRKAQARAETLTLQQARLVGLLEAWQRLEGSCQDQGAAELTFSLPLVLLSLRTAVLHTFGSAYQAWQRTPTGAAAAGLGAWQGQRACRQQTPVCWGLHGVPLIMPVLDLTQGAVAAAASMKPPQG